jgi:hypothetical protein
VLAVSVQGWFMRSSKQQNIEYRGRIRLSVPRAPTATGCWLLGGAAIPSDFAAKPQKMVMVVVMLLPVLCACVCGESGGGGKEAKMLP